MILELYERERMFMNPACVWVHMLSSLRFIEILFIREVNEIDRFPE